MQEVVQKNEYRPENKNVSVVLAGTFNPLMFHPNWFGHNEIISMVETEAVLSNQNSPCIISPNVTIFSTSQLQIQVQVDRFSVTAIKEPFNMVKDIIKKTFEGLNATPIMAMGINTSAHFKMPNVSKYQEFADRLSPKDIWKDLLGDNVSGDNRTGGLLQMIMQNKKDNPKGLINVIVEPSIRFKPGIYINCNDHYIFDENTDAEEVIDILEQNFDSSMAKSLAIQGSLFKGL
jgi:hypothetical protein